MPKRARPADDGLDAAAAVPDGVDEQGAFAFATCPVCGWRGAGRRSRERARKDLTHHLAENPHPSADERSPSGV